ncbi:nuclear transport factor 2 family protein [Celeribacter baekdonensis]|uniref:SnoaL-like domain-containing protein n=1 Tax=Celeribacter baekdonensis TaxID=875171 RepID=A0A2R4M181_9RHOB|nr:nuclear transport factor 2 family protein [Celeribacter baekdonensis]AVW90921.1 hypothetical protein DA792_07335 [Celeribacter baekdonensis]
MNGVELLKAWYERVWVQGDLSAIDDYFDISGAASGLMSDLAAELEDFRVLVPAVLYALRDVSCDILDSMEQDDRAWVRMRLNAKRAMDMKPVSISGQVMIRTKDGKICEAYNNFDFVSYFEQMGNLPPDTVALCLAGESLS